ncbi:MAG: hypothetical protein JWN13_3950 [Betaproteobacteria bacterium]|jgi:uncharacterized OB-fold protein|nr:hypothetical protein [Betaproteobacteria bacterium]MEA3157027.1 uncharacterized protein [Betaproteobacteria bacterium]
MATPYQERKLRDPALNPGDKEYFDAAADGKLMLKKCGTCGEHHHYPRSLCPFCFSDKVAWVQAKGTGTVYTYSITRRGGPVPYCIGYVTLDEGVKMMTNFVDCDFDTIKIGQKVKVAFKKSEGGFSIPMFTPA